MAVNCRPYAPEMRKLVFLFLLWSGSLYSQSAGTSSLLSVNEGLSQGMVFDLLQSRDGFIWIATKDGLNWYDGYHCKIFWPSPFDPFSISTTDIRKLFEDSQGRIWINTPIGVDVFVPTTGRFFHLPKERLPGFQSNIPLYESRWFFEESPDGAIWIANVESLWRMEAPGGAIEEANRAGNAFPAFRIKSITIAKEKPAIASICNTSRQSLLVGTSDGLYELATGGDHLISKALPGVRTMAYREDPKGRIWLQIQPKEGSPGWLGNSIWETCAWDGNSVIRTKLKPGELQKTTFDRNGFFWIAIENILQKWNPDTLLSGGKPDFEWHFDEPFTRTKPFYFPSMIVDRSGIAWLGTNGYGIIKVNPVKPLFTPYLPLISQRFMVEVEPGWLLFTFSIDNLFSTPHFDRTIPNPWHNSWAAPLLFDAAGNGWGLYPETELLRFDAQTKAFRKFPWKGRGLIRTRENKLLSTGEEGLLRFNPVTEQVTVFPYDRPHKFYSEEKYLYCLYEDSRGIVWIFGMDGLIKAKPEGDAYHFEYFKNNPADPSSLFNNFLLSVADDPLEPGRYLWIGTKVGLDRLDQRSGTFKHYSTAEGLPDNVIYGILSDNSGHIWLSTNKGLCRFHVREETVKNFSIADGLQNNEFNQGSYLKMSDGALAFGGVNGINFFYPDSLHFNENVPQTQIVDVRVNNKVIEGGWLGGLSLAHDQNFLSIEFAALEFSNPVQNRYRYRLIRHGLFGGKENGKEIELGEKNLVQFANLSPGRYTFQVRGSNNDGLWSPAPAVLEFVIRPPWWAGWWAWMIYIGVVGAGVWFFYRYQLRRRIEVQETLRLRELDDFKSRFFTNITHEFRTPLTIILGMAERLKGAGGQDLANGLNLIRRNGENLLRLINQLLDLAKLESKSLKINYEQGDVLPYLRYVAESLHSFANARNVMLRVESDEAQIMMDYDPERLLQIVNNLLSNAVKFSHSGGMVLLRATVKGKDSAPVLHLTVSDQGAGIPEEDLPHIFDRFYQANNLQKAREGGTGIGLALTRELVGVMGGSISVESKSGKGATFTVEMPITRKAGVVAGAAPLSVEIAGVGKDSSAALRQPGDVEAPQVLIIEDNPDVVEYLKACLEGHYFLDHAFNGRAGIEKALEHIPDLIISDVMMPEKDGFEVCDALKNDERTSHIPFILLTAKADLESRLAGLRRGADAYLTKPFHQEELQLIIRNQLELRKKLQAVLRERGFGPSSPASTPELPYLGMEDAFLQKIVGELEKHLDDADFGVPQLSRKIGLSQSQLYRKIKALTDLSTAAYIRNVRLLKGKHLLETTDLTMAEVAYQVGFTTPNYFSDAFLEVFGTRPNAMRK